MPACGAMTTLILWEIISTEGSVFFFVI